MTDTLSQSPPLSPEQGTDLSRISDARILRGLDWWRGLAAASGTAIPDRSQLDPAAIPDLLPHLVLWQAQWPATGESAPQFRCRLAGTFMVEIHGREFTGESMAQFHGAVNDRIQPEYDLVARSGRPHYAERSLFWMNRDYQRYCRILLPFTHREAAKTDTEAARVALILNVSNFF